MKKCLLTAAMVAALCFIFVGPAKADNLHLCNVSSGCSASSVIPISGTTAFVTGTANAGDTLFIAVLIPVADNSGNFNSSTNLWTALGESPNQVFPTLASAISQEATQTSITTMSFNVSDISEGAWTGSATITLPVEPVGTMFMAFTEDSKGNLSLVSPWSSSLINVGVPEPSSAILLGFGLLGMLALTGRKLIAA